MPRYTFRGGTWGLSLSGREGRCVVTQGALTTLGAHVPPRQQVLDIAKVDPVVDALSVRVG